TGLYLLVEKVVPEKDEAGKPVRIKVHGVFMNELDNEREDHHLRQPKEGWVYFKLTKGKEDLCRLEWKDLEAIARENRTLKPQEKKVVAFGSKHAKGFEYAVKDTVKDEKSAALLEFPVDHGMYLLS